MTPQREPASREKYTAADVKKAAGLSYRQLNDWEKKGVIPDPRSEGESWRKFTPREVFALMVCMEIRTRFGVPLESLRWVHSFMLKPGADHLRAAVEKMADGMAVLLMTDLKETFVMDSDLEFEDLLHLGMFRHEEAQGYLLVKLNPLVNRLLSCFKDPFQLKIHDHLYVAVRNARGALTLRSQEELEVLRLIRNGEYQRVTVHMKDGTIEQVDVEAEHSTIDQSGLLELLDRADFQTISVTKVNGKIVRTTQKTPIKIGVKSTRQRDPERRHPAR